MSTRINVELALIRALQCILYQQRALNLIFLHLKAPELLDDSKYIEELEKLLKTSDESKDELFNTIINQDSK